MYGKHTPYRRLTKRYLDRGFQIIKCFKKFTFGIQHFSGEPQLSEKGSGNAGGSLCLKQQHIGRRMDKSPSGWFLVAFITHLHIKRSCKEMIAHHQLLDVTPASRLDIFALDKSPAFNEHLNIAAQTRRWHFIPVCLGTHRAGRTAAPSARWMRRVSCSLSPAFCAARSRPAPLLPPGVLRTHQRPLRLGFLVHISFWATGSP